MHREITYNNFEISFEVFMPNITANHAITYTNTGALDKENLTLQLSYKMRNTKHCLYAGKTNKQTVNKSG